MDINGPEDRDHEPAPEPPCRGAVRRRPILAPLCDLIGDLSGARVGPAPSGREGAPPGALARRQEHLHELRSRRMRRDIDVDINICYGKAYIRVAR